MSNHIPPSLAPYIQQCIDERSLTLLTSVIETPTNWLLIRFVVAALGGKSHGQQPVTGTRGDAITDSYSIVFVSIWRSFDLWAEIARKIGLNLPSATATGQICYIDGLGATTPSTETDLQGVIPLTNLTRKGLNNALAKALQNLSSTTSSSRIVIIVDGLDFLLATQPSLNALDVQQTLLDLQVGAHSLIVTSAADSALLHNTEASATPLEMEHSTFARSLAHQSRWTYQLRPLETGQSKDVSGSLRVSKGGAWESVEGKSDLDEAEWLYNIKSDGSVRVWGRGEA